jgi:hypothetical protein
MLYLFLVSPTHPAYRGRLTFLATIGLVILCVLKNANCETPPNVSLIIVTSLKTLSVMDFVGW